MPDAANHSAPAARRMAPLAIGSVMILLVLYVLSIGPVFKYGLVSRASVIPIRTVYAPLIWLGRKSDTAGRVLDWYVFELCQTPDVY
jgi:hypothetical protein